MEKKPENRFLEIAKTVLSVVFFLLFFGFIIGGLAYKVYDDGIDFLWFVLKAVAGCVGMLVVAEIAGGLWGALFDRRK